ncbi:MAG: DUF6531 domain-containing protein, partial [Pseudomonadota bacterium]
MQCARASSREFRLARSASLSALLVSLSVGVAHAASSSITPLRGWQGGGVPPATLPNYKGTPRLRLDASCAHLFGSAFESWTTQNSSVDARGHETKTWNGRCATGQTLRVTENAYCPAPQGLYWANDGENWFCRVNEQGAAGPTDPQRGCTAGNAQPSNDLKTSHPIHLASGTKIQREVDYRINDLLQFTRFYRHRAVEQDSGARPVLDSLHHRWTHTYSRALFFTWSAGYVDESSLPGHIIVTRPDGRQTLYLRQGTSHVWRPLAVENAELTRLGDGTWQLRTPRNEFEHYNALGELTRVRNASGYFVDIAHAPDALTVTGAHGKQLTIALDAQGRATSLTDAAGRVIQYSYDTHGVISQVDYPDNSTRVYQYQSSGKRYLTGIVNERGQTLVSIAYSSNGDDITETLNAGRGTVTFRARPGNRYELVDQLGLTSTYTYDVFEGQRRLVAIDQDASTHCPQASASYEYDDDGRLTARVDWKGNRTTYVKDALNRTTAMTDAAGTAVAQTHATTWHPTWSKPTQRTIPGR